MSFPPSASNNGHEPMPKGIPAILGGSSLGDQSACRRLIQLAGSVSRDRAIVLEGLIGGDRAFIQFKTLRRPRLASSARRDRCRGRARNRRTQLGILRSEEMYTPNGPFSGQWRSTAFELIRLIDSRVCARESSFVCPIGSCNGAAERTYGELPANRPGPRSRGPAACRGHLPSLFALPGQCRRRTTLVDIHYKHRATGASDSRARM